MSGKNRFLPAETQPCDSGVLENGDAQTVLRNCRL